MATAYIDSSLQMLKMQNVYAAYSLLCDEPRVFKQDLCSRMSDFCALLFKIEALNRQSDLLPHFSTPHWDGTVLLPCAALLCQDFVSFLQRTPSLARYTVVSAETVVSSVSLVNACGTLSDVTRECLVSSLQSAPLSWTLAYIVNFVSYNGYLSRQKKASPNKDPLCASPSDAAALYIPLGEMLSPKRSPKETRGLLGGGVSPSVSVVTAYCADDSIGALSLQDTLKTVRHSVGKKKNAFVSAPDPFWASTTPLSSLCVLRLPDHAVNAVRNGTVRDIVVKWSVSFVISLD